MTWRLEKSHPYWDSNSDPSGIQPIASGYTESTIPAPNIVIYTEQKSDKMSSLGKDKKQVPSSKAHLPSSDISTQL
jgi:hypothetical protein